MKSKLNNRLPGIIIGALGPLLGLVLVFVYYVNLKGFRFNVMWHEFFGNPIQTSRFLSLAVIINLAVFYFFLRKDWNRGAMGIVLGTMLYIPVILYLKFFA